MSQTGDDNRPPLVVGISGASGALFGVELLRVLRSLSQPTHLVVSGAAERTLALEADMALAEVAALADTFHPADDIAAPIASGSYRTRGMIVAPCSMKTLSAIANSYADGLLTRAADVTLKERRPLVLMVRETPLHKGHLDLMARAADLGALILPPVPAFYHKPQTILDIVHQILGKALDHVGVEHQLFERWRGV
ncbi:MAG: UbiX family flavin prenyltransferase [Magnetospirillum sp. WYHS-4]